MAAVCAGVVSVIDVHAWMRRAVWAMAERVGLREDPSFRGAAAASKLQSSKYFFYFVDSLFRDSMNPFLSLSFLRIYDQLEKGATRRLFLGEFLEWETTSQSEGYAGGMPRMESARALESPRRRSLLPRVSCPWGRRLMAAWLKYWRR